MERKRGRDVTVTASLLAAAFSPLALTSPVMGPPQPFAIALEVVTRLRNLLAIARTRRSTTTSFREPVPFGAAKVGRHACGVGTHWQVQLPSRASTRPAPGQALVRADDGCARDHGVPPARIGGTRIGGPQPGHARARRGASRSAARDGLAGRRTHAGRRAAGRRAVARRGPRLRHCGGCVRGSAHRAPRV